MKGILVDALIRFKVGKNNFSEGPRSYDSFFFVDRFAKETRKFFNFSLLDGSAESFKYFPQCLQVRKAIVRFMQLIKCFIRTSH